MKRATPFWFGALLVASTGLLYCGGSSTDSTPPGGTTGTGTTSGSGSGGGSTTGTTTGFTTGTGTTGTNGAGTTTGGTTSTGAAGAPTTTAATTTTGGTGGAGGAGMGGRNGTGGTAVGTGGGGPADAGACPRAMPTNGTACAPSGDVCDYTGFACTCMSVGMTRDGGTRDGWACVRVRADGGGAGGAPGADASTCPRFPPGNATRCTAVGEICPYGIETCTCETAAMTGDRWTCAISRRDAGARD